MADGKGLALLDERLAEGAAVQETDWAAIIALIIPMIAECLNPKPESLRNPSRGMRASFAQAIRRDAREHGESAPSFAGAFGTVDAVFAKAKAATDAELQMLIDDCCS